MSLKSHAVRRVSHVLRPNAGLRRYGATTQTNRQTHTHSRALFVLRRATVEQSSSTDLIWPAVGLEEATQ